MCTLPTGAGPEANQPEETSRIEKLNRPRHATRIFVGGLSPSHTSAAVTTYFECYGTVLQVSLPKIKETGIQRGFAFVEFDDPEVVDHLLSLPCMHPGLAERAQVDPAFKREPDTNSKRGKRNLRKQLTQYFENAVANLLAHLHDGLLMDAVDLKAGKALQLNLTQAVRDGLPPSFAHTGALAHYTLDRLRHRTWYLYSALLAEHPDLARLREALFTQRSSSLRVASLAGGPGFDYVALYLAKAYLGSSAIPLECTIYDLEESWSTPLSSVVAAVEHIGVEPGEGSSSELRQDRVDFKNFDITQPLSHSVNSSLMAATGDVDLFVISFVVHEVASLLKQSRSECVDSDTEDLDSRRHGDMLAEDSSQNGVGSTSKGSVGDCTDEDSHVATAIYKIHDGAAIGGVFPQLFATCKPGARFIFLDVTGALWPAISACAQSHGMSSFCPSVESHFKTKYPLVLTKGVAAAKTVIQDSPDFDRSNPFFYGARHTQVNIENV